MNTVDDEKKPVQEIGKPYEHKTFLVDPQPFEPVPEPQPAAPVLNAFQEAIRKASQKLGTPQTEDKAAKQATAKQQLGQNPGKSKVPWYYRAKKRGG